MIDIYYEVVLMYNPKIEVDVGSEKVNSIAAGFKFEWGPQISIMQMITPHSLM